MISMTNSLRHARRVAAGVALPLCAAALLAASPASAERKGHWTSDWSQENVNRYEACVAKTKTDASAAYEDGLIFRNDGGGALARHCIALALLALGDTEEAAARLEEIAFMPDGGDAEMRAELLAQAGNAWLLARAPVEAENAFTQAMTIVAGDPDVLIDRARARALQKRFSDAVKDLDQSLVVRPRDVLALRLRADAYFELHNMERAEKDVDAALSIDPHDVETLVVRGRLKEARRVGVDAALDPSAGDRGAAPAKAPSAPKL
jgi:tetratricopeptide (TPR) repeat protein